MLGPSPQRSGASTWRRHPLEGTSIESFATPVDQPDLVLNPPPPPEPEKEEKDEDKHEDAEDEEDSDDEEDSEDHDNGHGNDEKD